MPSIFIWKSAENNTSKTTIRYYAGSNWFLEDNDGNVRSFLFEGQSIVNGSKLSETVIVFDAKEMKKDWVGTELLEVTQLPYKLIKSDSYGQLEIIGDWYRFMSIKNNLTVDDIHNWVSEPDMVATNTVHSTLNYDTCLIKYDMIGTQHSQMRTHLHSHTYKYKHKSHHSHHRHIKHNTHHKSLPQVL
jgi:hypothetical protein